ncbi:hypothetical protein P40081_34445 [Paenibacillus sp. FSL P4-0081]|nr:hypothetical protein P40081_34445 [Paenibacillus sp. FSL P4-0081]OMF24346.1 hypothetical protein BK132_24815 [Paenibacillus sp. FSL H8-0259]
MRIMWEEQCYKIELVFYLLSDCRDSKESLALRPLLSADFLIFTAVLGGNPQTKADAIAPTVPKFSSATFPCPFIFKFNLNS